jgi:hypothetical protein
MKKMDVGNALKGNLLQFIRTTATYVMSKVARKKHLSFVFLLLYVDHQADDFLADCFRYFDFLRTM